MAGFDDTVCLPRAWNYADPRNGADRLPLVYGAMNGGSGGLWECPCLSVSGFVYGVAGHAVSGASEGNEITVYGRDGALIDPAEYVFDPGADYQGRGDIAILTFAADRSTNEPITVRCQGKASGGALLENPVDVIRDFLTGPAGMASEVLNETSLARARSAAAGAGIVLSGLIGRDRTAGEILSEMLFPWADWWLDRDGRLCLRVEAGPGSYSEADTAGYIPARHAREARLEGDVSALVNRAAVEFAYNFASGAYQAGDDGSSKADALSQSVYGEQAKTFQLKWVRDAGTAAAIQSSLTARFKRPPLVVSLDLPDFRLIGLERGDLAALSLSWFYDRTGQPLANELMKVLEIRPDLGRKRIGLRLQSLGDEFFLTTACPADGRETAGGTVRAGGDRDRQEYF